MVVVEELAFELQHIGAAEAADTAAAQVGDFHARGLDRFQQTLVGHDVHVDVGFCQVHVEGFTDGGRAELLPVKVAVGPAPGARGIDRVLDQGGGSTNIEMCP